MSHARFGEEAASVEVQVRTVQIVPEEKGEISMKVYGDDRINHSMIHGHISKAFDALTRSLLTAAYAATLCQYARSCTLRSIVLSLTSKHRRGVWGARSLFVFHMKEDRFHPPPWRTSFFDEHSGDWC